MKTFTAIEAAELMDESTLETVNRWLVRGDGVAVYENQELGHPQSGHYKFASFGSTDALFETTPPTQLPDTRTEINWRYQLAGVYRGSVLEPAAAHDFALPHAVLPLVLNSFENRDLRIADNRLIAYRLEVGHQPDGAANCRIEIAAQYTPPIEGTWAVITLSAPTHAGGSVDRLGPWDWRIYDAGSAGQRDTLTGSDPNLGGAIVSICNLSAKKPGEGS